ncbi:MAG: DNA-binding protein WhiA, partial [Pseudonocardia sp.]|nr:DNA-binding protein WhiA [Pseudonocardia sp.]
MAMTSSVKDELSRLSVTKPCCRRSELSSLLRFAGGLHIVGGKVVIEAEVDTGSVARRLRREVHD